MSQLPSFYGAAPGGKDPDGLSDLAAALSRAIGQAMAPGSSFVNPFTGAPADHATIERQRLETSIRMARESSEQLARADSQRITNFLSTAFGVATGNEPTAQQQALAERLATPFARLLTDPLAEALLPRSMREFLVPTLDLPRQAAELAARADPTASITAGDVERVALGVLGGMGGGADPRISQGFSVSQLGETAQLLQRQGMLGADLGGTTAEIAAGVRSSLQGVTQVLGTARDTFGAASPGEAFALVQAVTGGAMGQQDPSTVATQLGVLKRVSESAGVAVDLLTNFINESVQLANKQGLSGIGAATTAIRSVQAGLSGAAAIGASLGGEPTPGVSVSADVLQATYQAQANAAQASPLAERVAVAMRDLANVAEQRGVSIQDLGGGATMDALLRVASGAPRVGDLSALSSESLVGLVASQTGEQYGQVAQRFASRDIAQRALAENPSLIQGVQALQPEEAAVRFLPDISRTVGQTVSLETGAAMLNAAVFSGGDPSLFRSTLSASGVTDPGLNVGQILGLEGLGRMAGITPEQAALFSSSGATSSALDYIYGVAGAEATTGGNGRLAPVDAALQRFQQSGIAGLLGAVPGDDVAAALASTPGLVEGLLGASGSELRAMADTVGAQLDPTGRLGYAEKLREMVEGGATEDEVRAALRGAEPDMAADIVTAIRDGVIQAVQAINGEGGAADSVLPVRLAASSSSRGAEHRSFWQRN